MRHLILLLLLAFFPFTGIYADDTTADDTYSTPNRLFYIARSANRNLVCYDVQLVDGVMDVSHPLEVYWINREEHPGAKGGLSFIQRKLAYGYKLVSGSKERCVCSLTAYPDRRLTIERGGDGYVCTIDINKRKSVLKSLFVKSSPRNPLNVLYVELMGVDMETGEAVIERVMR